MRGASANLVLIAAALFAAPAVAAEGVLTIDHEPSIALQGQLTARSTAGSITAMGEALPFEISISNLTGSLRIWRDVTRTVGVPWNPEFFGSSDGESYQLLDLEDARLDVSGRDEGYLLDVVPLGEATFWVDGNVDAAGWPTRLTAPVFSRADVMAPGAEPSYDDGLHHEWGAGWTFTGDYVLVPSRDPHFPAWPDPTVHASGHVRILIDGGDARIGMPAGDVVTVDTGSRETERGAMLRSAGGAASEYNSTWLVFEGTIGEASIVAREQWGLGAPELEWTLDGQGIWRDATGAFEQDGERHELRGARLLAEGAVQLALDDDVARGQTRASGEWRRLNVDGEEVALAVGSTLVTEAATTTATAIGLAALGLLGAAALYSRIVGSRILDHPRRRMIHDAVTAQPGIHLRALQRLVGFGWGAMTYHLDMLRRANLLVIREEGGYTVVTVPAAAPSALPRGAMARRVLDALPDDGSEIATVALCESLDVSRQRLQYNLRRLERQGLIVARTDGGRRVVSRAARAT